MKLNPLRGRDRSIRSSLGNLASPSAMRFNWYARRFTDATEAKNNHETASVHQGSYAGVDLFRAADKPFRVLDLMRRRECPVHGLDIQSRNFHDDHMLSRGCQSGVLSVGAPRWRSVAPDPVVRRRCCIVSADRMELIPSLAGALIVPAISTEPPPRAEPMRDPTASGKRPDAAWSLNWQTAQARRVWLGESVYFLRARDHGY